MGWAPPWPAAGLITTHARSQDDPQDHCALRRCRATDNGNLDAVRPGVNGNPAYAA
jgi:hypothetical protein